MDDEDEHADLLDLLGSDRSPEAVAEPAGRHLRPDAEDEDGAAARAPIVDAEATPQPSEPTNSQQAKRQRGGGTRADLRLMRQNPALLARCIAAVAVPFVLYTLVLLVIGRLPVYLLWIWIPAILAGVLMGAFLDAAYRRVEARTSD